MSDRSLSIIIPCYNEAENLPEVLPGIIAFCREHRWSLIVVDDGSTDGSRALLEQMAAQAPSLKVVRNKVNRGYGGAIKHGIESAETYWVATVDADGQHKMEDLIRLKEVAETQDADMVIGSRQGQRDATRYRQCGKWLIRTFARSFLKIPIHDLNSGMKLYRRDLAMRYLPTTPDNMSYSDIIALLFFCNRNLVLEEPITIQPRRGGVSTISTRTAMDTVWEISNMILLVAPLKFFLPPALASMALGLLWSLRCLVVNSTLSTGASFLILFGVLLLLLGMITEQLARIRRNM